MVTVTRQNYPNIFEFMVNVAMGVGVGQDPDHFVLDSGNLMAMEKMEEEVGKLSDARFEELVKAVWDEADVSDRSAPLVELCELASDWADNTSFK